MITQQEFETILSDETKRIEGDLSWRQRENDSPAFFFRADVSSEAAWPLFVQGWLNPRSHKLSYSVIHSQERDRLVGLDLGRSHRNPDGSDVGPVHKHQWSSTLKDAEAYVPPDITEPWDRPVQVWRQFCEEVKIEHAGVMHPPAWQGEFSL